MGSYSVSRVRRFWNSSITSNQRTLPNYCKSNWAAFILHLATVQRGALNEPSFSKRYGPTVFEWLIILVHMLTYLFLQGECAAANIQRIMMLQRVEARRSPITNPPRQNPSGITSNTSADLLRLVDADFALLSIDDESKAIGKPEPYREALAIMSYLQSCQFTELQHSKNIKGDFPGLSYPPGITLGGLLLIPLSGRDKNDFLVFFRKGQQQEVKWAGYVKDEPQPPD